MSLKIKLLTVLFSLIAVSATTTLNLTAQAEESWSSILKPLVSAVVMPMVNMGIDNMKTKLAYKKAKQASASMFADVQVEALSSAATAVSEMSWKLPEEPSN